MLKLWMTGLVILASGVAAPVSTNLVWMTQPGANQIQILDTAGAPITTLGAPTFTFNQPWDIVSVPSRNRVLVSNHGVNKVTIIDSQTMLFVKDVTIPNAINLAGMSVTADNAAVFVCGQATTNGPRVWRIDLSTESLAVAGGVGINDLGNDAVDCCAVRVGGFYKVYYSVTNPAPGYVGIVNGSSHTVIGSIQANFNDVPQAQDLSDVTMPTQMDCTLDERFVFVGCTKIVGTGPTFTAKIIRIVASNDSATVPALMAPTANDVAHRVRDVSFRTDSGIGNRGYVLANIDGFDTIVDIDETGVKRAALPNTPLPIGGGGPAPAGLLRFTPLSEKVYVGGDFPAATTFTFDLFDAKNATPLGAGAIFNAAANPESFVVVAAPTPVIADICPKAGDGSGPVTVTITGSGFLPGATLTLGGAAPAAWTVVNSTTIIADVPAGAAGNLNATVQNVNTTTGQMDRFYVRMSPPIPSVQPIVVPSLQQGYRMVSVPQYATIASVLQAFAVTFGSYNPTTYRIFFFRNGSYVEANQLGAEDCDVAGESFWVLSRFGGTVNLTQPDVHLSAAAPTDLRAIPVDPGWNMISVPFDKGAGQIPWANVMVTNDPTNFAAGFGVTTPAGLSMVTTAVEYAGGIYQTVTPLQKGNGYWVENLTTQTVYLVFDPVFVTKPGPAPPVVTKPLGPGDPAPPPPPGGGVDSSGSSSGGRCGLLGPELLVLVAAFQGLRRRRRLGA